MLNTIRVVASLVGLMFCFPMGAITLYEFGMFLSDWMNVKKHCPVELKFRQFQDFYAIRPGRFDIRKLWVRYTMRSHYRTVNISFSFFDTLRFLCWQHRMEKDAKTEADVNKALEFLTDMRANIYDFINSD